MSIENLTSVYVPNVETIDSQGNRKVKDIFSTLNDNRIVICDGEINDAMATVIIAQLLHLSSENDSKPINMYINSPGGSVVAGMAIFDTMMNVKAPINTIGMGMCASMGAFLLSAGNLTGKAISLPDTEIMIHQRATSFCV